MPLTDADRAAFAALPFDEDAVPGRDRRPELVGEPGFTALERKGGRPTLDVNGIWGGFQGEGAQDDHPGPRPRQGQLPARRGPGPEAIFEELRDLRPRGRPARRHGQVTTSAPAARA